MRLLLNKKLLVLLVLGAFVITLANFYQSETRNFFYSISEPLQKPLWAAGQAGAGFLRTFFHTTRIEKENEKLRLTVQELLAKTAQFYEIEAENKVLRKAFEIGLQEEFNLILAQVTGKNITEDSLIINKGSKDGVKNDMPVVTQQKVLLGRVVQVYDNFSRVEVPSGRKSSFDGKILGSEIQGLVRGAGNSKVTFDLVPQYEEVHQGELLTTTALGGIFPPGLLVGYVKSVKKSDVEPFQQIEIQPAFDIKQLEYLFIITSF
ncbi:MAG: rod shape-determining protein MreC [Parcubacteria group bacterium Gr01-1014_30]|nr:MAG: rod shape-determining protein MreC [Parcubacteria group bacterium Gr01-1014_30]